MKQTDSDQNTFEQRIKAQLATETDALDAATLSRLRQARERALEAARQKQRASFYRWPAGFGLVAVALLVAVVSWQILVPPAADFPLADVEDDLEIIIAGDDVNFYEEIEFLIWLEQQDHAS